MRVLTSGLVVLLCLTCPALAGEALVAVATNFAPTAEALARDYDAETGDSVTITSGATGKLYAQIGAGAPFDAFLSADQATVDRLVADGAALAESRLTYATGQLALWSANPAAQLDDPKAAIAAATHLAIANPDLAPYGRAAVETLSALGFPADAGGRVVMGENIGQAHSLVARGAADLGFVAASALVGKSEGRSWPVPPAMHQPIRQDGVLLAHGQDNAAARGFLAFLASDKARAAIAAAGYGTE